MIEIKITGETPMEALASITAFGLHCVGNKDVRTAAKRILDTELAKEAAGEPKLDTIAKANPTALSDLPTDGSEPGNPQEPAASPTSAPAAPAEPYAEDGALPEPQANTTQETVPAPTYLPEQIRKRGIDASHVHGTPAVKAILTELGVKGMGELEAKQYAAFMAKLDALDKAGGPDA